MYIYISFLYIFTIILYYIYSLYVFDIHDFGSLSTLRSKMTQIKPVCLQENDRNNLRAVWQYQRHQRGVFIFGGLQSRDNWVYPVHVRVLPWYENCVQPWDSWG